MKILLVSNYIYDRQISMQLFAKTLNESLQKLGQEVKLIRPKPFFGRLFPSPSGIGKWLGYIDKFFIFPPYLRKAAAWADIVHVCDHSNAFYLKHLKDKPHLVTCNDMLAVRSALGEFKQNQTRFTGKRLQAMILSGLNQAKYAVCISHVTRSDLLRISGLKPDNVSVVYMGFNFPYSPMEAGSAQKVLRGLNVSPEIPFILHVGKNNWYKNRLGVLEIYSKMIRQEQAAGFNLILIGAALTKAMRKFIKEHALEKRVIALTNIGPEELRAFYSKALALVYPSLAEGFGWPIIEAQACGCPVFTTNRPPMTEAGGQAAVYFEPDQPEEAADIILRGLQNRECLRQLGFENIKRFSTDKMVKEYLAIYEKLVKA